MRQNAVSHWTFIFSLRSNWRKDFEWGKIIFVFRIFWVSSLNCVRLLPFQSNLIKEKQIFMKHGSCSLSLSHKHTHPATHTSLSLLVGEWVSVWFRVFGVCTWVFRKIFPIIINREGCMERKKVKGCFRGKKNKNYFSRKPTDLKLLKQNNSRWKVTGSNLHLHFFQLRYRH